MKNILAKGNGNGNGYAMFIGRWQPWHEGHQWLIDQALNEGKKVLLCIRDVKPDEKNPWNAWQVFENLKISLEKLINEQKVHIIVIPDIESVNIGRGIGYDVIEHVPPQEIHDISATKIREQMKAEGKL
jgi:cytidyltransferase-like protein